jgi:hypothetical protein
MKRYHKAAKNRQSIENPETLTPTDKRMFLACCFRVLQMQLRHGRNVQPSDLIRLLPYCANSGGPEVSHEQGKRVSASAGDLL